MKQSTDIMRVNPDHTYLSGTIRALVELNTPKNPNLRWAALPVGFLTWSDRSGKARMDQQIIKDEIKALRDGETLLLPVNLIDKYHWVLTVIIKNEGRIKALWIDSCPGKNEKGEYYPSLSDRANHGKAIASAHVQLEILVNQLMDKRFLVHRNTVMQDDETSCGACVIANGINYANRDADGREISMQDLRRHHIAQLDMLGLKFGEFQSLREERTALYNEAVMVFESRQTNLVSDLIITKKIKKLAPTEIEAIQNCLSTAIARRGDAQTTAMFIESQIQNIPIEIKNGLSEIIASSQRISEFNLVFNNIQAAMELKPLVLNALPIQAIVVIEAPKALEVELVSVAVAQEAPAVSMADHREGFFFAICRGDAKAVKVYLANPAYNIAEPYYGITPLYQASSVGNIEIMQALLADKRIDIMQTPNPLYPAIKNGHLEAIKLLLSAGLKISERDFNIPKPNANQVEIIETLRVASLRELGVEDELVQGKYTAQYVQEMQSKKKDMGFVQL